MHFRPTTLHDAWLVEIEPVPDRRGFFARTFCVEEFGSRALETVYLQHSISYTARKGSIRGMHYQREPYSEAKVVRCIRGAITDVIIDIRTHSPSYRRWEKFELSSTNNRLLYIPKGFAHGFQTLCDDVEVSYLISTPYEPQSSCGIRYDDPAFAISWPLPVTEISDKDLLWTDFAE